MTQEEFPGGSVIKNLPANAGDTGDLVRSLGWEKSLGGGSSKELQYSCLENPMDRGTWRVSLWGRKVHGVADLDAIAMTMTQEAEHLFICLSAFHMLFKIFFLVKYLLKYSAHYLKLGLLFPYCWDFRFFIHSRCYNQLHDLQIFSPNL